MDERDHVTPSPSEPVWGKNASPPGPAAGNESWAATAAFKPVHGLLRLFLSAFANALALTAQLLGDGRQCVWFCL